ncbi:MAG: YagK/YfjJ domain-containing protein [Methylomicrobium sp.]
MTEEYDTAWRIISIDSLVRKVLKSPDLVYFIKKDRLGRQWIDCEDHLLFNNLKRFISEPGLLGEMYRTFPIHRINPSVEIFVKAIKNPNVLEIRKYLLSPTQGSEEELTLIVNCFNGLLNQIRREAESPEFIAGLENYLAQSEKNYHSCLEYFDYLFKLHARLAVLRLDFSYAKDCENPYLTENELYEKHWQIKKDLERLCNNMRANKRFEDIVGHVWKLEFTKNTGFHIHTIFFGDASKIREDVTLGRMIGEYWRQTITRGRGRYYNCNAHPERYKELGIGIVNADDILLRKGLEKAAAYLFKPDMYARIEVPNKGRSFGRGVIKPLSLPKRGRPRTRVPSGLTLNVDANVKEVS